MASRVCEAILIRNLAQLYLIFCASVVAIADEAIILEPSGTVTVVRSDTESTETAVTGQPLNTGDLVETGIDGSVIILLSNGTRVDLSPNSRLQVIDQAANTTDDGGLLIRLWRSILGKFADSAYTSAQAGGVGGFRDAVDNETIFNSFLSESDEAEMSLLLDALATADLPERITTLLTAIVHEDFGQFIPAEAIYLGRIVATPEDPVTYDLLFDLYLKLEFYGRAETIVDAKAAQFTDIAVD